jgi:hypothetical protein
MSGLDDEVEKVRAKQRAAMDEQAAQGSTGKGVLEAGVRAALDHALVDLDRDLRALEAALGVEVDAGSFLLGGLTVVLVQRGVDTKLVAAQHGPLLREYMAKARER